ncbi:MAG: MFSD8-like MFS transporter [Ruminococcaceae bacterium]|nr:MFSD8-like MFS transporter [Oscillospiraceae bacterium]
MNKRELITHSLDAYYLRLKIKLRLIINFVELLIYTFLIGLNNFANLESIATISIVFTVLYLIINVPLVLYSIKSKIVINILEIFLYGFCIRLSYLLMHEEILIAIISFLVIYLIINISLLLYDIIKLNLIINKSDKYCFYHTYTSEIHHCAIGRFYFTVDLNGEIENELKADTTAIYSFFAPRFEDWQNREVLVAHDSEKGKAFVIGTKEDFPDIPIN